MNRLPGLQSDNRLRRRAIIVPEAIAITVKLSVSVVLRHLSPAGPREEQPPLQNAKRARTVPDFRRQDRYPEGSGSSGTRPSARGTFLC